jgi:drug/metabolite transporter (DMT)-like permease
MQSAWMIVAGLCFSMIAVCVKFGANQFTPAELVLFRSALPALAVWAIATARKQSLRTEHLPSHLARGLCGVGALGGWVYAVTQLPMALGITLNYTAPLFLAVLTTFILKERFTTALVAAVLVGFVGIVMVAQPATKTGDTLAVVVGVASGFFSALAYLNVRKLGQLKEPEWRVVFYFSVIAGVVSAAWQLLQHGRFSDINSSNVHLVIAMGVLALIGQMALTRAYQRGNPLTAGALSYLTIVFSTIAGMLIFDDKLGWIAGAGIALVIASGLLAAHEERKELARRSVNDKTEPQLE